uniref:C2H2-type domain-containing protein n=1 Tax=Esox lucius TaxID=8010 RepID=A0AAY5KPC9_ESOLU
SRKELYPNQEEEQFEGLESDTNDSIFTVYEDRDSNPTYPSTEINFSSQTSDSREGDVLCIRIPGEIKTEPDGQCYTISEETMASQSLSEGYLGSAAQNENGSDSEVECEELPPGSKLQKSPRKCIKKGVMAHTSAGGREPTNADFPYCCKLCGKAFESIATTRTCNVCAKCFPSDANLRIHMVSHTGEKQHQCKECGKCFKTKAYMKLHMRLHTGEKPFRCKECGESFTCNGYLKAHMKFHTGQKSYRCKDCGEDFNQKEQLEQHMWTHRSEKPHGCQHCPKSFKRKEELTRHMAVHTGERPFKCTVCGHCFATPGNLTQHLSTHTGEKPYRCIFCSRCFRNNPLLKSHLKNRHKMS